MNGSQSDPLPPCMIFIDKEGHWFHEGVEMIRRDFIRLFYRNMELDSEGRHVILLKGQKCLVEVEDTAFVVQSAAHMESHGAEEARITLLLSDDTEEDLAPETLFVGDENVLYCRVKDRAFPARFTRSAYYQLARHVEEENGTYFLPLNGRRYRITL